MTLALALLCQLAAVALSLRSSMKCLKSLSSNFNANKNDERPTG